MLAVRHEVIVCDADWCFCSFFVCEIFNLALSSKGHRCSNCIILHISFSDSLSSKGNMFWPCNCVWLWYVLLKHSQQRDERVVTEHFLFYTWWCQLTASDLGGLGIVFCSQGGADIMLAFFFCRFHFLEVSQTEMRVKDNHQWVSWFFFFFFPLPHSIHFDCLELWWFAFVFQREHLKIAQQYFQLVGGSASECGKLNETLCATNISLVDFMHGQEYACLFLSEIYRAWLF